MFNTILSRLARLPIWLPLTLSALIMSACTSNSEDSNKEQQNSTESSFLNLNLPDSLTGGVEPAGKPLSVTAAVTQQSGGDTPCAFVGVDDEDPFRNGYQMTKFMVSAVAAWGCIADFLIEIAEAQVVPHDGTIHESDNDTGAPNYDPEDPTHYSITADSDHQTTIRLYYGYDRDNPPLMGEDPQFFVSWVENANAEVEGRMVINGLQLNPQNRKADDPTWMRMDFHFTPTQKVSDMFLLFDEGNPWAEGFRIRVSKNLTANALAQVFTAQGKIKMKAQFFEVPDVSELPTMEMYTVSDKFGNGAAVANFVDVTLPIIINDSNHLGNYLFAKEDKYVFDLDGDPVWVEKTFSEAIFKGGRTTPATQADGGTVDNPSLDMISGYLWPQQPNYFESNCIMVGSQCVELLNAIFADGFADQEKNQGNDPLDWRSTAIASPDYLPSVYPNGMDWSKAFDFSFTPTLVQ